MLNARIAECFGLEGGSSDEQIATRMREITGLHGPTTNATLWVRMLQSIDDQVTGRQQDQVSDLGDLAFTTAECTISGRRDPQSARDWRRELVGERPIPNDDVLLSWIAGTVTNVLAPLLISSGQTRVRLYRDPQPEHPNDELAEALAGYIPVGDPVDDPRYPDLIVGDLLDGCVVRITGDEVLVNIGSAAEAVIPQNELTIRRSVDPSQEIELHQQVEVRVMDKQDDERFLKVSPRQARLERAWPHLSATFEARADVDGRVYSCSHGGLQVDVGAPGFLPRQRIVGHDGSDLGEYVGMTVRCTISEMHRPNVLLADPRFIGAPGSHDVDGR